MASIVLNEPVVAPDTVVIKKASSADGTQTEVVSVAYNTLTPAGGLVTITDAGILTSNWHFVYYVDDGVTSEPLILAPLTSGITVQTLFDRVLPRLKKEPPSQDFVTTVSHVVRCIDNRLADLDADLLMQDNADVVANGDYQLALPSGMLGIYDFPYISTPTITRKELKPLPDALRGSFSEPGTARFYEVRGQVMNLYPTVNEDTTVHYVTYNRNSIVSMSSVIPYNGLFDDVIAEMAIKFGGDAASVSISPQMEALVRKEVDLVLRFRQPKEIYFVFTV